MNFMNPKFQFHEGPIKTYYNRQPADATLLFQFHEGPIKTVRICAK